MDVLLTFRQRDQDTHPFVFHVWRTSGHRRYAWEPCRSETTECRRNGVGAVRRLIADSICLLMNHPSTNSLWGVPEHRAIGRKSSIFSGCSRPYPCRSLSALFRIYSHSSLTAPANPCRAPLTYWQPGSLGQLNLFN